MVANDRGFLDREYLRKARYARAKLLNITVEIKDPELRGLLQPVTKIPCEMYLMINNAGTLLIIVWIRLKGCSLTVEDLNRILRELPEAEANISDPLVLTWPISLETYIHTVATFPILLLASGYIDKFKNTLELLKKLSERAASTKEAIEESARTMKSLMEEWRRRFRYTYCRKYRAIYIREFECPHGCQTTDDVLNRHTKELAALVANFAGDWRDLREDAARANLSENLCHRADVAFFLSRSGALWICSKSYAEDVERTLRDMERIVEIAYPVEELSKEDLTIIFGELLPLIRAEVIPARAEVAFNAPLEFVLMLDYILDAFDTYLGNRMLAFRQRELEGELIEPSEVIELRNEILDGLREYRNVKLTAAEPAYRIIEYGRKIFDMERKYQSILRDLDELEHRVGTFYREEMTRLEIELSAREVILSILFGIVSAIGISNLIWEIAIGLGLPAWHALMFTIITAIVTAVALVIGIIPLFRWTARRMEESWRRRRHG